MSPRRVKTGTWLYGGSVNAHVFIEEVDFRPGSGDYEDSEEDREDKAGRFFRIDYTSAGSSEVCASGGYCSSLEEAIRSVEKSCSNVQWDEEKTA
jgi:hypothetical protein